MPPGWRRSSRRSLVGDLETPVSAFMKLAGDRPSAFLLESVEGGATRGRYSMIGLEPDLIWRCQDGAASINRRPADGAFEPVEGHPLEALRSLIAESRIELPEGAPPMAAGLFGYLGYDMVRLIEHLPLDKPDPVGLPDALLMRPTIMVIFDSVRDEITVVTPVRPSADVTARQAHRRAVERLATIVDGLDRPTPKLAEFVDLDQLHATQTSNTGEVEYLGMVERAKEYVRAGDVFQVVLSQRFDGALPAAALRALSGAAAGQPRAVPRLSQICRLLRRLLQPGDPGAPEGRQSDHPADRRDPPARC